MWPRNTWLLWFENSILNPTSLLYKIDECFWKQPKLSFSDFLVWKMEVMVINTYSEGLKAKPESFRHTSFVARLNY